MSLNEGLLAQLRADLSSATDESSLSGIDEDLSSEGEESRLSRNTDSEDISSSSGEGSLSGDDQLAQLLRERTSTDASESGQINHQPRHANEIGLSASGDYDLSSSDDSTKLSRLERQQLCSPDSAGSNEWQLPLPQLRNWVPPAPIRPQAATGSESDNESQVRGDIGKHTSQNWSPNYLVLPEIEPDRDSYGYYGDGLQHPTEPCSPATPCPTFGGCELVSDTGLRTEALPPSISSGSEEELAMPRPRALVLQQEQLAGEIRDSPTSSVGTPDAEGADDGVPLQSTAGQDSDVSSGPRGAGSFDYRRKLAPLATQELRSFVFHDLTVSHNIPRVARQGFRSLHTSGRPSDPRTTRKRMQDITGLEEVRYDCCIEGCISYALHRYADLTQLSINGCKHARFKADGESYAKHSYIPLTHRLQLMYSDKKWAMEMMTYRAKMDEVMKTRVCCASKHA